MKKFYEKVCKLEELIALILVAGIAVLVFVSVSYTHLTLPTT